jgi:hypothetical protein
MAIAEKRVDTIKEWTPDSIEDDFSQYLYYFTDQVFSAKNNQFYNTNKTIKPLISNRIYKPDYKLSYKVKEGIEFDLFIAEGKPTEAYYAPNKCDLTKINIQ